MGEPHAALHIGLAEVKRLETFKFLGIHISRDLTWSHNMVKKSRQRLCFLGRLQKCAHPQHKLLTGQVENTEASGLGPQDSQVVSFHIHFYFVSFYFDLFYFIFFFFISNSYLVCKNGQ